MGLNSPFCFFLRNGEDEMRKSKKQYSLMVSYAIRYGMVVFLTAFFIWIVFFWLLQEHKNELLKGVKKEFQEIVLKIDELLVDQRDTAGEIYLNTLTRPSHMNSSDFQALKGLEQLNVFKNSLEIKDYLFLKYSEKNLFIETGSISISTYTQRVLQLNDDSTRKLELAMEDYTKVTVLNLMDKNGRYLLAYLYPVPNTYPGVDNMIGFLIKSSTLQDYIERYIRELPVWVIAVGEEGEILFEINQLEKAEKQDGLRTKLLTESQSQIKNYSIDTYQSISGITFHVAIGNEKVFEALNQLLGRILIFVVLVLVFLIILLYFLNRNNVREVQKIRDDLLKYNQDDVVLCNNEIQQIKYLLHRMYMTQENQKKTQILTKQSMSRQIARQLCSGAFGQEEILTEMIRVFCPKFEGESYIVLGVVSEEPKEKIVDSLTGEYPFSLYSIDNCNNCSVISFIIGLKCGEYSTANITELTEQLACFVDKSGLTHLFIVTGRAYQSYFDMNKSFDEMLTLAYYVLSEGSTKKVNIFQDEMIEQRTACIGDKGVILLKGALQKRDVKEAEKVLCQVRDENGNREDPILQRFQGYVLLQLLYDIFSDMGVDSQTLESLLTKDLDEKAIKNILKISTKINLKPVEHSQELMDYINHNYKDSALNLEALAVKFHKSVSVISRDIKKLCGQNYTDYISELRLEEACRLLRETSMSVQDITFEVGYMDKASFRRKFKAKTGVLPGEYRMAYKEIKQK